MTDLTAIIEKLRAWRDHDFHADRQLSDEILIADGWTVTPDASFEGGVRWQMGPACCSESTRPHLIHSLDRALGVVPRGFRVLLEISTASASASVWREEGSRLQSFDGVAPIASVAVLLAALRAIQAPRDAGGVA